jgi:hypothetical protein
MSFSDIITPRPEILRKDGIDGVIDIENIRDAKGTTLESRPGDFLELTYPTADIKFVVENLHQRFTSGGKTSGLFLLEGYKGTGKSHLELLVYHLFKNPEPAKKWLAKYSLACDLPSDCIVFIRKFTDFPIEVSLWVLIFEALGRKGDVSNERIPTIDDLRRALAGKHLILILDELERGIQGMSNASIQIQNLSFLQMLSEESLRSENASVTIIASVYNSQQEPGATLKRVQCIDVKFSDPNDRQRVVLHRLFSNSSSVQRSRIDLIVQGYTNSWRNNGLPINEKYVERCVSSYPFSPELLEMVLFNVPAGRGFQGNRGSLTLLSSLVRSLHKKVDLITAAHLNIEDAPIRNKLADLDPVQTLMQCALNDLKDLRDLSYAGEIISSVLMGTLAPSGHLPGISEHDLARQVLVPGADVNKYHGTLQALLKLGTYFQRVEDHYVFDEHEKPNAKVEYRSLQVDPRQALDYALDKWKTNLFGDSTAVVFREVSQVKKDLSDRDSKSLRFVLSPKRLDAAERVALFHGAEYRNQIVLLEPKADSFNIYINPDITKWAQRAIAATLLLDSASDAERTRQYEKIARDDTGFIIGEFRKAGLSFVWVQPSDAREFHVELEPLGTATSHSEVKDFLSKHVFPRQVFEEHLVQRIKEVFGKTFREIDNEYRKTLGFPVRIAESTLRDAIKNLCISKQVGLEGARRFCGEMPLFSEAEWWDVHIVEPFESGATTESLFEKGAPQNEPHTSSGKEAAAEGSPTASAPALLKSVETPFANTIGALRQAVAEKLGALESPRVKKIQFAIFAQDPNVDLGTLSPALRGTLNGSGDFTIDLHIGKAGDFTKAEVEQLIEELPTLNKARYRAEMKIEEPQPELKGG